MIYKAIFHFDLDDEKRFALGLTSVANLIKATPDKPYDFIMLFNGPGATMVTEEKSASYAEIINTLQDAKVSFKVCGNAMNKFEIAPEELIRHCEIVQAGIVTLIEFQNEGYAYIKP